MIHAQNILNKPIRICVFDASERFNADEPRMKALVNAGKIMDAAPLSSDKDHKGHFKEKISEFGIVFIHVSDSYRKDGDGKFLKEFLKDGFSGGPIVVAFSDGVIKKGDCGLHVKCISKPISSCEFDRVETWGGILSYLCSPDQTSLPVCMRFSQSDDAIYDAAMILLQGYGCAIFGMEFVEGCNVSLDKGQTTDVFKNARSLWNGMNDDEKKTYWTPLEEGFNRGLFPKCELLSKALAGYVEGVTCEQLKEEVKKINEERDLSCER